MATVAEALQELKITEWVLRGEPTKEDEFKNMFRKVTGADENGSAIETDDTSKWGVTWKQISDKMTAIDAAAPMKELRVQRDAKLAETDWTALSDVTMADNMKTYRQALRDLPASNDGKNATLASDGRTLENVKWPQKPA
jgi:CRISPR/Cas system-associated endonuclease Cas1